MYDWIILMALTLAALSLSTSCIVCRNFRRMRVGKERNIEHTVRRQEQLLRELALTRNERRHLRQVLTARLPAWEVGATVDKHPDTDPRRFDTPYNQYTAKSNTFY